MEDLREKIDEKKSEMEEPLKKVKSLRNEVRVRCFPNNFLFTDFPYSMVFI